MEFDEDLIISEINGYDSQNPPTAVLRKYLLHVARTGETTITWKNARSLFIALCDREMRQFYEQTHDICFAPIPNAENVGFDELRSRILSQFGKFVNAPFTIQRIAELLAEPRKQYTRADKFMRGLERALLVVTQVDPYGNRILREAPFPNDPLEDTSNLPPPSTPKFDSFIVPHSPLASANASITIAAKMPPSSNAEHQTSACPANNDRDGVAHVDLSTRFGSSAAETVTGAGSEQASECTTSQIQAESVSEVAVNTNEHQQDQEHQSEHEQKRTLTPEPEPEPEAGSSVPLSQQVSGNEANISAEQTGSVIERADSVGFEMDTSESDFDAEVEPDTPLDSAMTVERSLEASTADDSHMDTVAPSESAKAIKEESEQKSPLQSQSPLVGRKRPSEADLHAAVELDSEMPHASELDAAIPTKQRRVSVSAEDVETILLPTPTSADTASAPSVVTETESVTDTKSDVVEHS